MTHALIWTTLSSSLVWCLGTTLIVSSAETDEVQTVMLRMEKEFGVFQQVSWENQCLIRIVSNLRHLGMNTLANCILPSTGQPTEQSDRRQVVVAYGLLNCYWWAQIDKCYKNSYSSHLRILPSIFWNVATNWLYLLFSNEQVEKNEDFHEMSKGIYSNEIAVKEEIANLKTRTHRWLNEKLNWNRTDQQLKATPTLPLVFWDTRCVQYEAGLLFHL